MNIQIQALDQGNHIHVVLEGGPGNITIPEQVTVDRGKIKLPCRGGHEHFERVSEDKPSVFRWTMRTSLAE
ncbi:DUF5988 family protein [Lentzea sp. NPDC042327]|uniref:DUF5988 family protein n=1 Tax=Lentzea sp. NPDC042327 TaxID=3154801 RepID=UPI0033D739A1